MIYYSAVLVPHVRRGVADGHVPGRPAGARGEEAAERLHRRVGQASEVHK